MVFVIPYFIPHLGCPHQCLFCNQNSITGTERSVESIGEEIRRTITEWLPRRRGKGETQFAFYGGSFTCLPRSLQRHLLEIVAPWLDSGEISSIRLSTRPDCIDEDVCRYLVDGGVGVVELGAQSFDDRVLRLSLRGHTAGDSLDAIASLHKAGISIGIQLMPGLPGETRSSFRQSVAEAVDAKPSFVRIYPALVVQDSGLADLYIAGEYRPLTLDMAVILVNWARRRFVEAGIGVVRMGLQPSESLEKHLLAGPYHPAFGELVVSREWLKRVKRLFAQHPGKRLELLISHRDLSSFNGLKRNNIRRLEELGLAKRLEVIVDRELERGQCHHVVC